MSSSYTQKDTLPLSSDAGASIHFTCNAPPTFCYFVIDSDPTKLPNENKKYFRRKQERTCSEIPILYTRLLQQSQMHDVKSMSYCRTQYVGGQNEDTNNNANNNCSITKCNTPLKGSSVILSDYSSKTLSTPRSFYLPKRQRHISECSDDSFVCFVEEENYKNAMDSDYNNADYDNDDEANNDNESDISSNDRFDYYFDSDLDTNYSDSPEEHGIGNFHNNNNANVGVLQVNDESMQTVSKKVRFDLNPQIHTMYTWDFAYRSARKGVWENYARDRSRFNQRIQRAAIYIDPILVPDHRRNVFKSRFAKSKSL